jgi:pyruvate formate lyase activating enzyme
VDVPPTPGATLTRARRIAQDDGLLHVYTGNVHDTPGGTTTCPVCGTEVVVRDWQAIVRYRLEDDGRCRACGAQLPGVCDGLAGRWGRRRLPVSITRAKR